MLVTVAWWHWLVKCFYSHFLLYFDKLMWTCWLNRLVSSLTLTAKLHLTFYAVNWSYILRLTFFITTTSLTRTRLTLNTRLLFHLQEFSNKSVFRQMGPCTYLYRSNIPLCRPTASLSTFPLDPKQTRWRKRRASLLAAFVLNIAAGKPTPRRHFRYRPNSGKRIVLSREWLKTLQCWWQKYVYH